MARLVRCSCWAGNDWCKLQELNCKLAHNSVGVSVHSAFQADKGEINGVFTVFLGLDL